MNAMALDRPEMAGHIFSLAPYTGYAGNLHGAGRGPGTGFFFEAAQRKADFAKQAGYMAGLAHERPAGAAGVREQYRGILCRRDIGYGKEGV